LVDSARRFIHDTILVAAALDSSKKTVAACSELVLSCDQFRKMATDSMRALVIRLRQRDEAAIHALAPPPAPRFDRGIQLGVGYCIDASGRHAPCASITYGFQVRIF
jgi:hypothetical protein